MHRHGVGVFRQILDLVDRHAHVVQPFLADLLAGAFAHRLLDIVAGLVGEQTVHPYAQLVLGLVAELLLAVQRPAHQPVGILDGDDAAGDDLAGERVALADLLDIRHNLWSSVVTVALIQLVSSGSEQNLSGWPKLGSCAAIAPHIPAAAGLEVRFHAAGVLGSHGGVLDAAAVGDEHQIVLGQVDGLFVAVAQSIDAGGLLLAVGAVKRNRWSPWCRSGTARRSFPDT